MKWKQIMGGFGSGNRSPRPDRKATVEEFSHLSLGVSWFARVGVLVDGGAGDFTWRSPRTDAVILEADYEVYAYEDGEVLMGLTYRLTDEETLRQEDLFLDWDSLCLGGKRWWFFCPRCGLRRARLYLRSRYFACRVCHQLTYQSSQRAHYLERARALTLKLWQHNCRQRVSQAKSSRRLAAWTSDRPPL